jgi:hypothetical protein
MLRQVRELQSVLSISEAQLLDLARRVSGDGELRCVEEMIGVDMGDLQTELLIILMDREQRVRT